MKSVLLVSPYPYTQTTRGMDVFTQAFEESGWETHHLQFPEVVYSVKKPEFFQTTVHQLHGSLVWLPYIDSLMWKIPHWLFSWFCANHQRSVRHIPWDKYDAIVLESGKPVFLLDVIPPKTKLIYRVSDPIRLILGRNPYYINLEDKIVQEADFIVSPKKRFIDFIPESLQKKVEIIPNGMHLHSGKEYSSPYKDGTTNAVYVGLHPLDIETLHKTCRENPSIDFHFFGLGLQRGGKWKLSSCANFINHGFQPSSAFLPYLAHADMFISPFRKNQKPTGISSKYYLSMNYKLPIVSYPMEPQEEFEGLPMDFCNSSEEFSQKVKEIGALKPRRTYNLNWEEIAPQNILNAYKSFITKLS